MKNHVLTALDAARILYPGAASEDPRVASPDDVAAALITHFSFTINDLARLESQPPAADLEILLASLGVGSLEELHDLVERGKRGRATRVWVRCGRPL